MRVQPYLIFLRRFMRSIRELSDQKIEIDISRYFEVL
jgi:hypothetical protein